MQRRGGKSSLVRVSLLVGFLNQGCHLTVCLGFGWFFSCLSYPPCVYAGRPPHTPAPSGPSPAPSFQGRGRFPPFVPWLLRCQLPSLWRHRGRQISSPPLPGPADLLPPCPEGSGHARTVSASGAGRCLHPLPTGSPPAARGARGRRWGPLLSGLQAGREGARPPSQL